MRRRSVIAGLLAAGLLASTAAAAPQAPDEERDWGPGSRYGRQWDPKSVITIEGTVTCVEVVNPQPRMRDGVAIVVLTGGRTPAWVTVHLGPRRYVDAHAPQFRVGQRVTVTGSLVQVGARWILMASEVVREDGILLLRDERGAPLWWALPATSLRRAA